MKRITLMIFLALSLNSFAQESITDLPKGLDGIFEDADNIDFSAFNDYITRMDNASLNLDKLVYWTEAKGEFYIHLEVNYYDWQNGTDKPEPTYSFSRLFKETIKNEENIHTISQNKLSSLLDLENITNIGIRAKIVKVNDKQEAINKVLGNYINSSLTSNTATEIVKDLLETQKKDGDEYLSFKSDYDVPLNSIEFAKKKNSQNSSRLLYNNKILYIPIDKKVDDNLLKPSLLQSAFDGLSALTGLVTGETFSTTTTPFEGMIKVHFTSDDNLNIPYAVKKGIDDVVFTMNVASDSQNKYKEAETRLWNILETTRVSENSNYRLNYGIREFLNLSSIYKDLVYNQSAIDNDINEFNKFYKKFLTFYKDLDYLDKTYGFVSYGVGNIYKNNEFAKVYVPLGLDERTIRIFIRWQVAVHQYLENQGYSEEYKLGIK